MNKYNFASLAIKSEILQNLSSLGYDQMTPIQAESLELILNNQDIIAQAKTGSGKTVAFGIGLLSKLDEKDRAVQAVVLCPTRELAEQVAKEIRKLARAIPNIKILTLCGGRPLRPEKISLEHGAHVVVGTPGRILDHLYKKTIDLRKVQTLVLDEADRMLDMGFSQDLSDIVNFVPHENRQTLLFSATFPDGIIKLSKNLQKNTQMIKVDTEHKSAEIEQLFFQCTPDNRVDMLDRLLATYKPESTLIFCNTKQKCKDLALELNDLGYSAEAIHGDLEQRDRNIALVLFANKSSRILVATDVAARGLDIKDLSAVINFELSVDPEVHVHRVGRTGRAGKSGLALSLFSSRDERKLKAIEEYQNIKIVFGDENLLDKPDPDAKFHSQMISLRIGGGKKNKLRPGDILGTLTASAILGRDDVGKIDILEFQTFVAVAREKVDVALGILQSNKIKGHGFRVSAVV